MKGAKSHPRSEPKKCCGAKKTLGRATWLRATVSGAHPGPGEQILLPPPKGQCPQGREEWRQSTEEGTERGQGGHTEGTQGHGHRPGKGHGGGAAQHHTEGGKTEVHGDKVGSSTSLGRQRLVPGTLADTGRCWSHRVPILGSAGEGQQAPRADNIAAFDSKASESLPRRGSIWLPGSAGGVSSLLSKGGSEGWDGMGHSSLQIWCHPLQQENCSSPLTISIFKSARSAGFLIKLK